MSSNSARFRPWLAVLAGTLAAVLLVEALRPKASTTVQTQAPTAPATAAATTVATPAPVVATTTPAAIAPAVAPTKTIAVVAKAKSTHRHAHRKHKQNVSVAKLVIPVQDSVTPAATVAPLALAKDSTAPRFDSLAAVHSDSCIDGVAFVSNDSLPQNLVPKVDSIVAQPSLVATRPSTPEIVTPLPQPCLQLPKTPDAIKPEAAQAIVLPNRSEKQFQ